ncbi:MAG: ABC transporter permease [Puniceicoccales bacterium]|jgi:lipoprotein-releasing system permease protein|nr:ABC transporter permease [Puniceicoccales bacterium]
MWTLKLALHYLFPKGRMGTFFTWISIAGIALGVMVLTIVLSIMNGFDKTIHNKLIQINGQIKILSSSVVEDCAQWMHTLENFEGVSHVTPFVQGIALVQHGDYVQFPRCLGVDEKTVQTVLPLNSFVRSGDINDLNQGVFVTKGLVQTLNVNVGDTLDIYSPLSLEAIKRDEVLLPKELPIIGIFETGWAEIDKNTLLCSLETLQDLYGLANGVHGFSLNVKTGISIQSLCLKLNAHLPKSLRAYSWMELDADFLHILKLEKAMSFFVLLFVILVACFSISSGLMSSVVRKTREIALLRIWGAQRWQIAALFCWQATFLSSIGILLGFMGGLGVLHYRNGVIRCLTGLIFPKDFLWNFYSFSNLPVAYAWQDFALVGSLTFIIALLAAVIPALKASFSLVARSLRSE